MYKFGLEHEVAFLKGNQQFADFTNTTFKEFNAVVEDLPQFETDYPTFRVGDQKIKVKRWYVEGYERFDEEGGLINFVPKGIEVRNLPKPTIAQACQELTQNFQTLIQATQRHNLTPTWISYNPFNSELLLDPPLNVFEQKRLEESPEERTGYLTVYTYGPDLNISRNGMSDEEIVDIGKKLTFYSPFIIPFSFSSPFYQGQLWDGYSVRTHMRTGDRHAVRVFVKDEKKLIKDNPLVSQMRTPSEKYRIEFKAMDVCNDFQLYASLLTLMKGLVIDTTLKERALTPNKSLHQLSAKEGFNNQEIASQTAEILAAAEKALEGDGDIIYLKPLKNMLEHKHMPAQLLIDRYTQTKDIIASLRDSYQLR